MKFERSVLSVNIYGESKEIRFPTLLETKSFTKAQEKGDEIESLVLFLESLGLERKVSESMEVPHLTKIIEALSSEKKS